MAKRLSLLMGISIFMVVLGHAAVWGQVAMFDWAHRYRPVTSPNFDMIGTPVYYVLAFIRQAATFPVAAFLFVAGFFSAFSARSASPAAIWKSVRARIVTLLIPYTIWSVLVFLYQYILGERLAPWQYLSLFLTWGATGPYYYIPLLCTLTLLAPLLVPLAKTRGRFLVTVSILIQLAFLVVRYLKLAYAGTEIAETLYRFTPDWLFLQWILFFVLGIVAAFHLEEWKAWTARHQRLLVVLLPISLAASILEADLILRMTHVNLFAIPLLGSTMIFALVTIITCTRFLEVPPALAPGLIKLAGNSYGIYLLHYTIMEIFAKLTYHYFPGLLANLWVYIPILFLLGLGIPLLVMELIHRTPLRKVNRYLFG